MSELDEFSDSAVSHFSNNTTVADQRVAVQEIEGAQRV